MSIDLEVGCCCARRERRVECPFDLRRQFEVADCSAGRADQVMVMVVGECFGKFVASVVVMGDDSGHDANLFEDRKVPIHTRLSKRRFDFEDLRDRDRVRCGM